MPICFRCGKTLSTNQALEYHLNKIRKCNELLRCKICNKIFNTKLELNLHERQCETIDPLFNMMKNSNSKTSITIVLDDSHKIIRKSHYIDSEIHFELFQENLKESEKIQFSKNFDEMYITFVNGKTCAVKYMKLENFIFLTKSV